MSYQNESILDSIKKLLGLADDYTEFDKDIILHINSVFATLHQLGVGPSTPFSIEDKTTKWSAFISDTTNINNVVSYVYLHVRLLFDPPTNSSILSSYKEMLKEYEWRLNVAVDNGEY